MIDVKINASSVYFRDLRVSNALNGFSRIRFKTDTQVQGNESVAIYSDSTKVVEGIILSSSETEDGYTEIEAVEKAWEFKRRQVPYTEYTFENMEWNRIVRQLLLNYDWISDEMLVPTLVDYNSSGWTVGFNAVSVSQVKENYIFGDGSLLFEFNSSGEFPQAAFYLSSSFPDLSNYSDCKLQIEYYVSSSDLQNFSSFYLFMYDSNNSYIANVWHRGDFTPDRMSSINFKLDEPNEDCPGVDLSDITKLRLVFETCGDGSSTFFYVNLIGGNIGANQSVIPYIHFVHDDIGKAVDTVLDMMNRYYYIDYENNRIVTSKLGEINVSGRRFALSFDGEDDYVDCGNVLDVSGSFTVLLWVDIPSDNEGDRLIGKGDGSWPDNWRLELSSNKYPKIFIWKDGENTPYSIQSDIDIKGSGTRLIFGGYNQSSGELFVGVDNAEYKSTNVGSFDLYLVSDEPFWIMAPPVRAKGVISQVRVYYNRILSQSEIEQLYLNPNTQNSSGLVLWLKMSEGTGSTVFDYSGNANHGTIYGATWFEKENVNIQRYHNEIEWNVDYSDIYNFIYVKGGRENGSADADYITEFAYNASSIAKYGLSEFKPHVDEELINRSTCRILAEALLEKYHDKRIYGRLKGIPYQEDFQPGYTVNLSGTDHDGEYLIQSISADFEDMTCDLVLSNTPIDIENEIRDIQKSIELLKRHVVPLYTEGKPMWVTIETMRRNSSLTIQEVYNDNVFFGDNFGSSWGGLKIYNDTIHKYL